VRKPKPIDKKLLVPRMEMNPPQVEEGLENLQNEEITEIEKNADDFKTVIGNYLDESLREMRKYVEETNQKNHEKILQQVAAQNQEIQIAFESAMQHFSVKAQSDMEEVQNNIGKMVQSLFEAVRSENNAKPAERRSHNKGKEDYSTSTYSEDEEDANVPSDRLNAFNTPNRLSYGGQMHIASTIRNFPKPNGTKRSSIYQQGALRGGEPVNLMTNRPSGSSKSLKFEKFATGFRPKDKNISRITMVSDTHKKIQWVKNTLDGFLQFTEDIQSWEAMNDQEVTNMYVHIDMSLRIPVYAKLKKIDPDRFHYEFNAMDATREDIHYAAMGMYCPANTVSFIKTLSQSTMRYAVKETMVDYGRTRNALEQLRSRFEERFTFLEQACILTGRREAIPKLTFKNSGSTDMDGPHTT
jgi:hypothetical protein